MLVPQYTIRTLLILTTVCAVAFSVFALALRGYGLAIGISAALVAVIVLLLVHAGIFGMIWLFSVVTSPFSKPAPASPSHFDVRDMVESDPVDDKDIPASPMILD